MDANKGTAEQCLQIARGHLRKGNFNLAKKMLMKSKRLYPLPGVDALIARAETSAASGGSDAARMDAKKKAASSQRSNPSASAAPTRPFTPEQQEIVRRIKRQGKDHYGILGEIPTTMTKPFDIPKTSTLGVDRSASEADLKKAYRKVGVNSKRE